MFDNLDPKLLERLQAASHAMPVVDVLRDLADDVSGWEAEGVSEHDIDSHIRSWLDEHGLGFDEWKSDLVELEDLVPGINWRNAWEVYGIEDWVIACVKSIAHTDRPIPFYPYSAGFFLEIPDPELPLLVAVMTPLTDPRLAGKQLLDKHREFFGRKAGKPVKADEVDATRMIEMHRAGMSYREIAIQNLRAQFPDILYRAHRYKVHIDREKDRIAKRIKAAKAVWKERTADSSTAE